MPQTTPGHHLEIYVLSWTRCATIFHHLDFDFWDPNLRVNLKFLFVFLKFTFDLHHHHQCTEMSSSAGGLTKRVWEIGKSDNSARNNLTKLWPNSARNNNQFWLLQASQEFSSPSIQSTKGHTLYNAMLQLWNMLQNTIRNVQMCLFVTAAFGFGALKYRMCVL